MGIPCYYDDDEEEEDLLQNLNGIVSVSWRCFIALTKD
jgi:hypothetical protein